MKKIATFLMIICILVSSTSTEIFAAKNTVPVLNSQVTIYENSSLLNPCSTTFTDTSIDVSCSSAGMSVTIHTSMTMECSVIGVKDTIVEMKNGNSWVTVATVNDAEIYNASGCAYEFLYSGAVYGQTYRISCTHYANGDEYRELQHTTESFKFIY